MECNTLILGVLFLLGILVLVLIFGNLKFELKLDRGRNAVNDRMSENLLDTLSNAEYQVLKLLANGKTNKEIAEQLNISLATVKTHVSNIFRKLGIRKRSETRQFGKLIRDGDTHDN